MVGLARVVLTRREHVVMLEPFDKGLLATTLRYPYEVRDHADYFEDIPDLKLPAEMKKLAAHIVDTKAGHFEPKSFEDHYETALVELVKSKQAGKPIETVGEEPTAPRVINLMDALRASIDAGVKKPAAASTDARRAGKKKAARADRLAVIRSSGVAIRVGRLFLRCRRFRPVLPTMATERAAPRFSAPSSSPGGSPR